MREMRKKIEINKMKLNAKLFNKMITSGKKNKNE